jgi:RimJ/RimL family protein N-acetyltransferase
MTIKTFSPRYLDQMVRLYNLQVRDLPHAAPLTPRLFQKLVAGKSYFDPNGLFLAVDRGMVTGWVHACLAGKTEAYHKDPLKMSAQVRMLVFKPGQLKTGRLLVEEATRWLKRGRQPELLAMHCKNGYPFYRGLWYGGEPMIPATLPHLQVAFETTGYKLEYEGIYMACTMRSCPKLHKPWTSCEFRETDTVMKHGPMRESWTGFTPRTIEAYVKGEPVGSIGWVMIPQVKAKLGAPLVNIWGMGVNGKYQRMNIATSMVSRVLRHGYKLGARFSSVSTQLWNTPAQATYAKLGYVPHTILTGRTLKPDKKKRTT